jgi:chromatin segregation and condensation protein Rec8/ScpA/Scc1 (kleisin family)
MTENLLSSKTRLLIGDNPVVHIRGYLEPDRLNNYYSLIAQAENAVKGSPDIVKRIRKIRLYLDYAVLEQARKNKQPNVSARAVNFATSTQDVNQILNNFLSNCKQYGVTRLMEGGLTPEEYKKSF